MACAFCTPPKMTFFEMKKAKWIWINNADKADEYVRFLKTFSVKEIKDLSLRISCDGIYNAFVNGKLVGFGMMYDYKNYKMADCFDLSKYCVEGENSLEILVWYLGESSHCYCKEKAGLFFEIKQGEELLFCSDESVLCKYEYGYVQGAKKLMTKAIGYTFKFDNNAPKTEEYCASVAVDKEAEFSADNPKNLRLEPFVAGEILSCENNSIIIDLKREYWGYLSFELLSKEDENEIEIVFGEHIKNGHLIHSFDGGQKMNYKVGFVAKKGINQFTNLLRALGCRYLEFIPSKKIKIISAGVYPLRYPFTIKPFTADDSLEQKIYDTSLHTLFCCTSKHYIDCPWREQSSYVMDSRNQMLFGYYAFENPELARYNLIFLSKGIEEDGLLSSCPPAKLLTKIPFFSLIYIIQVYEYLSYTGDASVLEEVSGAIEKIMATFLSKFSENGLIGRFEQKYWNFYEWTEGSSNWQRVEKEPVFDLILNATFVLAINAYRKLSKDFKQTDGFDLDAYRKIIYQKFFNAQKGLFKNDTENEIYSRFGNGIALLAEIVSQEESELIAKRLIRDDGVVDVSLAAATFYYDALLKVDKQYAKYIRADIREKYSTMLEKGATTFWETLGGQEDFGGSGSLCHGWSALPVYYYWKFKNLT